VVQIASLIQERKIAMSKIKWFALLAILTALIFPAMAVAQPSVCGFYGVVTSATGTSVANGTVVTAWIDGAQVATTTASSGNYVIKVAGNYDGKTVSFKIGDVQASKTGTWTAMGNIKLDLAATGTGTATGTPKITLSPSAGTGAVVVNGTGFTPGSAITIKWDAAAVNTVPSAVVADASGTFGAIFVVPVATADKSANYTVTAADNNKVSATATFTVPATAGTAGPAGPAGPAGAAGAAGKDANMALVWVALIVGVVGIIVGGVAMSGVSKIGNAMKASAQQKK